MCLLSRDSITAAESRSVCDLMLSLVVMSTSFALIVKECLGGEEKVDLLKKKSLFPIFVQMLTLRDE